MARDSNGEGDGYYLGRGRLQFYLEGLEIIYRYRHRDFLFPEFCSLWQWHLLKFCSSNWNYLNGHILGINPAHRSRHRLHPSSILIRHLHKFLAHCNRVFFDEVSWNRVKRYGHRHRLLQCYQLINSNLSQYHDALDMAYDRLVGYRPCILFLAHCIHNLEYSLWLSGD